MITERTIRCYKCDVYVGTIRDAKLMKGLLFVCPICEEQNKESNPFADFLSADLNTDWLFSTPKNKK